MQFTNKEVETIKEALTNLIEVYEENLDTLTKMEDIISKEDYLEEEEDLTKAILKMQEVLEKITNCKE
jgi:hypothetical protein